ncbi:hypothetical protein OIPHN330_58510 (plasmid) [Citrobacter freundii]|nr:hypothetical protein TMSI_53740 [Klebsiella quasipneumoniae]BBM27949.1 Rhs family protein [Enterobacter hormaechei subsp. hoffmannii]BEJ37231.1 hypothetical protein OIPHN330_58510 [Citrobacter freundii]BEJ43191.1 hypothetical protein OIPHN354_59030 [Citrobacter freundii]
MNSAGVAPAAASGQVVWKADYNPFGKASITTQGPTFNLRFPGQYYDAETGLHYNWRRYYDPATGRYITSDPIGLAGGINTYAYALSNPIGNADPTGEFVPLLLGAYAAVEFALSAWDAYDTFKTITSDCATTGEKWAAGGLFAAGVILPGNYGWVDNVAKVGIKRGPEKLYHYTDNKGFDGIMSSKSLNPSLKKNNPSDARYGDGQYLSDIAPGTKTCAQLSRCFFGNPFQGNKVQNYIEIDVRGLDVQKGREGVYVIPGDKPLDLSSRIIGGGRN